MAGHDSSPYERYFTPRGEPLPDDPPAPATGPVPPRRAAVDPGAGGPDDPTRRRRFRLALATGLSIVVLALSGGTWAFAGYVNNGIDRVDAGTATGRGPRGPVNILIVGADRRDGLTREQQARLHLGRAAGQRADTMMLVHLSAAHDKITVVSLPRDSYVPIPGYGPDKLNAAYAYGGPKLTVRTVQEATGLPVQHYVEINFLGFIRVVDALGGVRVCLPEGIDDAKSGLRLAAGRHDVDGATALSFARTRVGGRADLDRIDRQQQFLSSMLDRAVSAGTLTNPARLSAFLDATLAAVRADHGLDVRSLAEQLKDVSTGDVTFTTVPVADPNFTTPTGASALLWDRARAREMFRRIGADEPVDAAPTPTGSGPPPSGITLAVYNGTRIGGLAAGTASRLRQLGFTVQSSGTNWKSQDIARTVIRHPRGQRAAARTVRAAIPGAAIKQVAGLTRIQVVLGASKHDVKDIHRVRTGPASTRTAAQYACR